MTGYLLFLLFELKGLAEFGGGHTGTALEYAAEVLGVVKGQHVRNFREIVVPGADQRLRA